MVTVDELTNFSGNQGEDALRWYKSFLSAIGPLGERGMLNHFPLYMEPGSRAQIWCDELPKQVLSSWVDVDRNFRRTWLGHAGAKGEDRDRFQNHHLTDDAIFSPPSVDVIAMNKVVVDWAQNHLQLGAATKLDDATLIQATMPYLPAFIRAFLKYKSTPPKTFKELCTRIKEIEDHILEFEQLRRQEKSVDWQTVVEKKLDDVSETVKESQVGINALSASNAGIGAEVIDTTSFFIPEEWKKAKVSASKPEMVEIVKEVIRTLLKCQPPEITIDAAHMMNIGLLHYYNAIKALDQYHSNSITGQAGIRSNVWLGLFQANYQTDDGSDDVVLAINTWDSFSGSGSTIQRECVYKANHVYFTSAYDGNQYNVSANSTPYYGGLAQIRDGVKFQVPHLGVSSLNTALYFLLSAYLAERVTTNDEAYKRAAIDSANWIINWAYDGSTHLAKTFTRDMWKGLESGTTALSPHVTGLFIEGLCVLADVTGEQKWRSLAINTCNAAMVYRAWHDGNGVFKYVSSSGPSVADDTNMFRGLLIRGLLAAYRRNPTNKRLRHTIRSYINVQYNALRDGVRPNASYPVAWNGPHSGHYVHGQLVALEVLMTAVVVNHC